MKSEKGFTLIEVIVIAVIVGILSLIAIQLYTGYVQDARQEVVNNIAETAAAAANAYWRKTNQSPPNATVLNLHITDNSITVTISGNNVTATKGTYTKSVAFK